MRVQVRLFATFRIGRFTEQMQDFPPGTSIRKVVEELGIDASQIGTVFVDCKPAELDQELHENARLGIFPMVGGG
jgi:molybdopterin converting factor small subunit